MVYRKDREFHTSRNIDIDRNFSDDELRWVCLQTSMMNTKSDYVSCSDEEEVAAADGTVYGLFRCPTVLCNHHC